MTWQKKEIWEGKVDTSVEEGGNQIEYDNQHPIIHRMFLDELDKRGLKSEMGDLFDEEKSVLAIRD